MVRSGIYAQLYTYIYHRQLPFLENTYVIYYNKHQSIIQLNMYTDWCINSGTRVLISCMPSMCIPIGYVVTIHVEFFPTIFRRYYVGYILRLLAVWYLSWAPRNTILTIIIQNQTYPVWWVLYTLSKYLSCGALL